MTPWPGHPTYTLMTEQGLHSTSAPTSPTTTTPPTPPPPPAQHDPLPTYSPTHVHSGYMSLPQGPISAPSSLVLHD